MQLSKKKLILIILIALIGIIILLSVIYQQTSLWKPEQSLITLLPESPICYLTIKELEGVVNTFNRSEFGKQAAKMPIITHIKNQHWWELLVDQKLLWEYEMGGKLDMGAVKGHFGKEAIIALYQREGELSFILITELGGPEKLAIETITATDAINPNYKRIQTEYNGLTINTITGYPLDFSYTFIGKIGVLCLNPLLLAEVIDIYSGEKDSFLAQHPIQKIIQDSYDSDTNTGYVDLFGFSAMLKGIGDNISSVVEDISPSNVNLGFLTFGNRYEEGTIISKYHIGRDDKRVVSTTPKEYIPKYLPKETALVSYNPHQNWNKLWNTIKNYLTVEVGSDEISLSKHLNKEMTVSVVTHQDGEVSKFPSLVLHTPIQDSIALNSELENIKNTKIAISGIPLEFLEVQDYKGIPVHPVRLRFNFLLSLTGGYAVVDNEFFFCTTIAGLKSVLSAKLGDTPALKDIAFSKNGIQTFIQPNLLVPEIVRLIPIATILASLSEIKLDARLMQNIKDNLFPLESLGPITADIHYVENIVDAEVRIVVEK